MEDDRIGWLTPFHFREIKITNVRTDAIFEVFLVVDSFLSFLLSIGTHLDGVYESSGLPCQSTET